MALSEWFFAALKHCTRAPVCAAGVLALALSGAGAAPVPPAHNVLVYYDHGADAREPALADARYLTNLLGHFNTRVRVAPVAQYQPGAMNDADTVFYVTYEKDYAPPPAFLNDFARYPGTFVWLNHQLARVNRQFLKNTFGFHPLRFSENQGFSTIDYQHVVFPKGDDSLEIVTIDDPAVARVISWAYGPAGRKEPYIVHAKNLWFVGDSPFSYATERDRSIAFADLLHDILRQPHPTRHTALVRIEDINPSSDAADVRRLVNYLHGENVPFAIGVVPLYIDPTTRTELHLADNPKLLSLLRGITARGGTVVLHGYTHQYHGATTDDYEFWDDIADKPVRGDSEETAGRRIDKAIGELLSNDVYPFAWETPHYFASRNTYLAVKQRFSAAYDRTGVMNYLGSDQLFPYELRNIYGQFVIPENLGYVSLDKPDARPLIEAARLNLAVRDGYASFFIHPFVNMRYLKQIVPALREMGYTFRDIKEFSPRVTATAGSVICGSATVHVNARSPYVVERVFSAAGKELSETVKRTAGRPITLNVAAGPGSFVVVKPADALEPGLIARIWQVAKKDLNYFRFLRPHKTGGVLSDVKKTVFITPAAPPRDPAEAHDAASLRFSLSVAGVPCTELAPADIPGTDLREYDIIVVPLAAAKALSPGAVARITEAVRSGAGVLMDGPSPLADACGIKNAEDPISVRKIRDLQFPEIPLCWPAPADVYPVYTSPSEERQVLAAEEVSNAPLAVSGKFGAGSFIYYCTYFDPLTDRGYSRFPFLIETLQTVFKYQQLASRKTAEMYFDPGMRQYISIEKLVKLWRAYGIKTVYASGWHFYDKYTYDYARLIRVCHENGILVYCWLEPPMVNQKFWNKYPQWREKTALLKEGGGSWRLLMNLADPACLKMVFAETENLLAKYDWDGVNVAEMYYESLSGPSRPDLFTPMNALVRTAFEQKAGFDPVELFRTGSPYYWKDNPAAWNRFAAYRRDLCTSIKEKYLRMLADVRKKKGSFEIILTFIDTTLAPAYEDYLAEDLNGTIALQKKYGCTLQVEDASPFWSGTPDRYTTLGTRYRALVPDPALLQLDCNVLDTHPNGAGGLPAEKPTGEEMRQIAYNMSVAGCRPVFYSEETILEHDFSNIGMALARDVVITSTADNQWNVSTPAMATVFAGKKNLIVAVDDNPWYAMDGESIIVPAGEHTIRFEPEPRYFDLHSLHARLTYISADLTWAKFEGNDISFAYAAGPAPCLAIFSKRPARLFVDDTPWPVTVYGSATGFTVKLPSGTHSVRAVMSGGIAYVIESSGVVIFSLIIIFGFFGSILFIGLFVLIQIKRKFFAGHAPS